jgi:hypothetical protein
MSTTNLLNLAVSITVSDPWEFGTECGTGPFAGTITDVASDWLIIRLAVPIAYRGNEAVGSKSASGLPRHPHVARAKTGRPFRAEA